MESQILNSSKITSQWLTGGSLSFGQQQRQYSNLLGLLTFAAFVVVKKAKSAEYLSRFSPFWFTA